MKKLFLTLCADLFFVWALIHFGLGGTAGLRQLLAYAGLPGWGVLGAVLFLLLFRSDYRSDLPLFAAGVLLGYWGEWWGTTRGVWAYWNGATPPTYLPPLWGIGLLTVFRLSGLAAPLLQRRPAWAEVGMKASLAALPVLGFALSWRRLAGVDWTGRLDLQLAAGVLAAGVLILVKFNLRRAFTLYLCGMLLGGLYETLGTRFGEWRYITGETPPLWILPLWGLACVAMANLAQILRDLLGRFAGILRRRGTVGTQTRCEQGVSGERHVDAGPVKGSIDG
jgi:hypothetical protein